MTGSERVFLAVAAVLACAHLALGLARTDLWPPDEPRVAEMSREMTDGGSWVVPALNGEPFVEEPPLFNWMQAAAYGLAGSASTVAARVPAALAAMAGVIATATAAAHLGASPLVAAIVLATAPEYWWMARSATPDTAAAAATTASLGAFFVAWRTGRRAALLGSAVALSVAFWCKSFLPVGLAAVVIASFVVGAGRGRIAVREAAVAAGGVAAVAAGWLAVMASALGARAAAAFVVKNHLARLSGGVTEGHVRPVLYYLPNLALDFLPWAIVLPVAAAAAWRARATPERRFAFCWAVGMLVVLSLSASKRAHYLLAAYPGFALLVATWWPDAWRGRVDRALRRVMIATVVAGGPLLALAVLSVRPADVAAIAAAPHGAGLAARAALLRWPQPSGTAWLAAAGFVAFGVVLVHADDRRRIGSTAAAIGLYATAIEVLLALVFLPRLNVLSSARAGAEHLGRLADRGVRVVAYRFADTSSLGPVLFYGRHRIPEVATVEALAEELRRGPTCAVMRAGDYAALTSSLPGSAVPADAFPGLRLTIVESAPGLCTAESAVAGSDA